MGLQVRTCVRYIVTYLSAYLRNLTERRKSFSKCLSFNLWTEVSDEYVVVF
jgi:hypothetical protein